MYFYQALRDAEREQYPHQRGMAVARVIVQEQLLNGRPPGIPKALDPILNIVFASQGDVFWSAFNHELMMAKLTFDNANRPGTVSRIDPKYLV